ncbi:MAG: ribonuclease R [Deltaproteobacteria bacterium GWA2_38_16]|nr:MAG: ribonuclease R [Deltaproteobacteria bacterium GWA2_38_16]OGQ02819.1 MAG: ribonuclease R [Deltaproteobacteria bacterium RIFCSPHIGHO2_02_FULL_38_15]OGQ34911.1 MAG: ribonuclease R [Deltaproteobacteria bacterium RIFCSPLOWO2_01_FULL_38_9]HBQ21662.1 ribonuclease R [Deltaproteobacteria bacterium]
MNIGGKEILDVMGDSSYKPMTFDELCHYFKISQKERKLFRRTLKFLYQDRKIIRGAEKRYRLPQKDDFVVGILKKHSKGFGFLIPDDTSIPDVYLSNSEVNNLMNKDRLKVMVGPNNSGKVVEILQRGTKNVVGTLFVRGKTVCVIPQGSESTFGGRECILIPFDKRFVQSHKQVVVCKIKKYQEEHRLAEGEIIKVLGKSGVQEVDFSSMAYKYDLPQEFSKGSLEEAAHLKQWNLKDEVTHRMDLKKLPFMTIDGETAKDFDDAVCVQKMKNGHYKLWVSIADVSFFVRKNSHIDQEAYERGTSVYFPGGVIPMLPEVLSNDLCSLRPEEEKMTFTCEMEFDPEGNRRAYTIYESVIISRHRMTYTDIQAILDKDSEISKKYSSLVSDVLIMNELKERLKEQKQKRGCLDFDLPESELILDVEGAIETIVKRSRLEAHMLIEEFMIAANEAVAEFMFFKKRPFIYRVHEEPSDVTLAEFNELAHNLGYPLPHQKVPHAKIYSELLKTLKGEPQEKLLNTALLRSMKLARYADKNLKHFGLASECYTHFTSPIRRYPDLMVHRLLKAELKQKSKNADTNDVEKEAFLARACEHCSKRERTAEEAEREFVALKKAQFMMDKVGQEFVGYVSGVTEFGVFVELEHYFIEGLVHMSSMQDDFYQFIEEHYMLKGRRTKKEYHLGQKVLVEVKNVNIDKRQIDFIFRE